jgi:hypothetical protein
MRNELDIFHVDNILEVENHSTGVFTELIRAGRGNV